MHLFQQGSFQLRSGPSDWKIECDSLSMSDWEALAHIASQELLPFGIVISIPRGGDRFAECLSRYKTSGCSRILLADDVYTSGESMRQARTKTYNEFGKVDVSGVVAFSRGRTESWIVPVWKRG